MTSETKQLSTVTIRRAVNRIHSDNDMRLIPQHQVDFFLAVAEWLHAEVNETEQSCAESPFGMASSDWVLEGSHAERVAKVLLGVHTHTPTDEGDPR